MSMPNNGEAFIEGGAIVIRIPLENLPAIVEGAWAGGGMQTRLKVTNLPAFAKELCAEINREEEDGTTPFHRMFDAATEAAFEGGGEGIEIHEQQEA